MTKFLKLYVLSAAFSAFALTAWARPSVLSLSDHTNDSTIVYPESVETDVNQMMQNWYLQTYTALDKDVDSRPDVETTDNELIERLQAIPTTIEMPFNSVVRNYIDLYTGRKRSLVESMLGMSLYYMPIFEQAIERQGIPIELKYLPVIESALNPDAVSRAGAVGLWQIMLPTARGLGLEINTLVDERRDPVRSSEAAATYLRQLHDIYSDWSLAIAAYNCGPGNVNKALRRAELEGNTKKDFWAIYPYLPAETRGYVPCFIAATYVMNYYHKHNISPALAKRPIVTDSVHVKRRIHFDQIADILHIPVEEIKVLNPQYRKCLIPGTPEKPCPLVLPSNQVYSYIMSEDAIAAHNANLYARRDVVEPATGYEPRPDTVDGVQGEWVTTEVVKYHKVRRKETLASIARKYGVTLRSLKQANGNIRKPRRGQTIKVVTIQKEFRPYETQPQPENNDQLLVRNPQPTDSALVAAENQAPITSGKQETTETPEHVENPETAENAPAVSDKVSSAFSSSKAKQEAAKEAEHKASKANKHNKRASKEKPRTVKVRKGDNMYKIAKRNGMTLKQLERLNPSVNPRKIKPGDKIRVK